MMTHWDVAGEQDHGKLQSIKILMTQWIVTTDQKKKSDSLQIHFLSKWEQSIVPFEMYRQKIDHHL